MKTKLNLFVKLNAREKPVVTGLLQRRKQVMVKCIDEKKNKKSEPEFIGDLMLVNAKYLLKYSIR